jgi:PadR family transcriptional regulator AphA
MKKAAKSFSTGKSVRTLSTTVPSMSSRHNREKASRFAILGMLALGKTKSGYDIKKAIATSTSNFWSESYGNIYPTLQRLLADGAICEVNDPAPTSRRQKQLYRITSKGNRALKDWLRQPVAPRLEDNEFLLKLFFGAMASTKDSRALVHDHREYHVSLLKKFEDIEGSIVEGPNTLRQRTYTLATLEYGRAVSRALIAWSDATTGSLHNLDSCPN